MGGSLKDYLSIFYQNDEPRNLNLVAVTVMLERIGDALEYLYSEH